MRLEPLTSEESMALPKSSIINCTNANRAVAQFAYELLKNSQDALPLIITIRREKSEDSFAITATIESSGDIRTVRFSDEWLTTLNKAPVGSSQKLRRKREKLENTTC